MPRVAAPMSALQVRKLAEPGYHAVGHVAGLYMQVTPTTTKSWVLRVTVGDKRREIGLGSFPEVELGVALDKARQARQLIAGGVDPVEAKREAQSRLLAAQRTGKTFTECANTYIDSHEAKWKNSKHAAQWRNTLTKYAGPVIGKMLVRDIEMAHVLAVIEPIWKTKTETADRVRGRIEAVLGWAETRGYRTGANPARWKGFLDTQLAAPSRIAPAKHHASMPMDEVAAFMHDLTEREGNGARALEFLILTNVRVANVRMAAWAEMDMKEKVWTIPGEAEEGGTGQRMKTGVEFKVPLSDAAVKLLEKQPRIAGSDLIFPSPTGKVMSDMTLLAVMRRMSISPDKAVPHGFRSTFKTWASERTHYPPDVIEAAMGHKIKDKVEAAYMRGNWLDKRRPLMQDWAKFVYWTEKAKVLPMLRRTA